MTVIIEVIMTFNAAAKCEAFEDCHSKKGVNEAYNP